MNKQISYTSSALGIYAGILGVQHGIFEILQGNNPTPGFLINAIGPSCQPDTIWHACFPALSLVPNFLFTGILAVITGLSVVIWSGGFIRKQSGGHILVLLSLVLIPVGGGFVPALIGVIAGTAGTKILAPLPWWQKRSGRFLTALSAIWPWVIYLIFGWAVCSWVLGYYFNQVLLDLGFFLFLVADIVLPLVCVFSGMAEAAKSDHHREQQPTPGRRNAL